MKTTEQFTTIGTFEYPGKRNEGNYLLLGDNEQPDNPPQVIDVANDPIMAVQEMDQQLRSRGLPLIEDRVPVLAFGRNASPAGAAEKTAKYSNGSIAAADLQTVPMLKGTLKGHDVVWHGRPGKTGNYFSELLASDETADTEVEVWVQFLTNEQLAAIHVTEGATYGIQEVPGVDLGNGVMIDTVAYVARDASVLLDDNGKPIAMAGAERTNSQLEVMNEREASAYTLGRIAVAAEAGAHTPDDYQAKAKSFKVGLERDGLQLTVQMAMKDQAMTRPYQYQGEGAVYSRIDFDDLPHGLTGTRVAPETLSLMEQSIAKIRPTKEVTDKKFADLAAKYPNDSPKRTAERVRNLLDPAVKLRERATDELLDPRREKALAQLVAHKAVALRHSDN